MSQPGFKRVAPPKQTVCLVQYHRGLAEAALVIINTGRDVVIDKISVRRQECSWSNVYYWRTNNITILADLNVTQVKPSQMDGTKWKEIFTYLGNGETFQQASSDLTLKSGWTIVLYIEKPDSISSKAVSQTVGITVFTANAQYYVEANVEAAE